MQAFVNSVMYSKFLSVGRGRIYKNSRAKSRCSGRDHRQRAPCIQVRLILSAPTKLPRTEFCIVKRTCEISDVPHLPPFAKLPETLCRKPYFHIYHIIPHIKKIVKALAHKNLDYLYDHFGKRIVKSYKRAESRETDGNLKKFIPISRENEYPKL